MSHDIQLDPEASRQATLLRHRATSKRKLAGVVGIASGVLLALAVPFGTPINSTWRLGFVLAVVAFLAIQLIHANRLDSRANSVLQSGVR